MVPPSAGPLTGVVTLRVDLDPHLVRIVVSDLDGFLSSGVADEWVSLIVPGQFQSRYYTVRDFTDGAMTLDVVVHDEGLVTRWAQTDCVGQRVGIAGPKGSYLPAPDAQWVVLAGDLTALPAMARILETETLATTAYAEVPDLARPDYFGDQAAAVTWSVQPQESALADLVGAISWPEGPGYFWMAGESAHMREIRRHCRRDLGWDAKHHDVMGYWSRTRGRATRAVDPGPIYERGKAQGKSDDEIWADYDAARGSNP